MFLFRKKAEMPNAADALPGRSTPLPTAERHYVNGHPLKGPYPEGTETIVLGLGCFWGAERRFWQLPQGVFVTAVGYAAGYTPNPTYEEVCTGRTGHNEVVLVAFDPAALPLEALLRIFFESHNPTQGMRQGNDVGTQYRSASTPRAGAGEGRRGRALGLCRGAARTGLSGCDHRNRTPRHVLLRRGVSSAILGQESRWLLRPRRHGCHLSVGSAFRPRPFRRRR